jgi:hypothetical protein
VNVARAVELDVLIGSQGRDRGTRYRHDRQERPVLGTRSQRCRRDAPGGTRGDGAGSTCIKFTASDEVYSHAEEPGAPQLTVEEARVDVEEAYKAKR